jgi:hypothetical protein
MAGPGSQPGERKGGREAGTPNKWTGKARDAVQKVFDKLQGEDPEKATTSLLTWARANPGEFYTKIYVRLLPIEQRLAGHDGGQLNLLVEKAADNLQNLSDQELYNLQGLLRKAGMLGEQVLEDPSTVSLPGPPASGSEPAPTKH